MERSRTDLDLHQVFDHIMDAVVVLDKHWRYTYVNEKACSYIGRLAHELIGRDLRVEFPESVDLPWRQAYERAMAERQPITIESYSPTHERWFEDRIYPSADGLMIYFLDITERRQAQELMRLHQRMLDDAQQIAHLGSWEWDISGNRVTWSAELYRIYGLAPGQYAATFEAYLALVHPLDRMRVSQLVEQACIDHQPFELEERIVRADGEIRTLCSRGAVQLDEQGRAVRMFGACQDITERKRAEQMDVGQRDILAGIAAQRPLAESLERIARLHEELNPRAMCSILLLDDVGRHVLHGAAPSLPDSYSQALHGAEIGDGVGSCGTAAWRRERVIVADIASHPYWLNFRALALAHGLRACWSTPVLGSAGQVLGTFAVYYSEQGEPNLAELENVDRMLPITGIAIESAGLIGRLQQRNRFFDMSLEFFCVLDPAAGRLLQCNPSLMRMSGYSGEQLTAGSYRDFFRLEHAEDTADPMLVVDATGRRLHEFVNRCLCRNGSQRVLEWVSFAAPDGLVYAVARDITERRRIEEELAFASSHDSITGLPHHLVLEGTLAAMLATSTPTSAVWILVVGLDRFQVVNESVGHVMGDDVLLRLAIRLETALGDVGQIIRFAGDEFVVLVQGISRSEVLGLADRLRAAVAEPIDGRDYRLLLTASVGISQAPEHGDNPKDLLRRAEAAMTRAKREGRDQVREYSIIEMQDLEDRLLLGSNLRNAIRGGELELHYQPQQKAGDHTLVGFEALLRWNCRELGGVPPTRFIPIAEALGLMPEIGEWVLDAACRQIREWLDAGHRDFTVSVNVSAQQLQRSGLVDQVREVLRRHGVAAHHLDIEITESSLMENVGRIQHTLDELKALGVSLSLDDFGTGYSSLAYLKHFPFDKLKIDQSFVHGLPTDADSAAIAKAIIVLAHQLDMLVAAEGVETEAQSVFLHGLGCDELQGYHVGHPQPAHVAQRIFERSRAPLVR